MGLLENERAELHQEVKKVKMKFWSATNEFYCLIFTTNQKREGKSKNKFKLFAEKVAVETTRYHLNWWYTRSNNTLISKTRLLFI